MKIIVAGPGCARCNATEKNVREAVRDLNLQADVSHEFDIKAFRNLGVKVTPAVLVDGKIIISGKLPTVDEIKAVLANVK